MVLTITLPDELGKRIAVEAAASGLKPEAFAVSLLEKTVPRLEKDAAIDLLETWASAGDASDQSETFDVIRTGLKENHTSDRAIYPDAMKGLTW